MIVIFLIIALIIYLGFWAACAQEEIDKQKKNKKEL